MSSLLLQPTFFRRLSSRLALLLFLTVACLLPAQNVRLQLSEPPYYAHVPFTYHLVLTNTELETPPVFGSSSDLTISVQAPQTSRSQQITIINGKRNQTETVTTIYPCHITPLRTGRLTIPAATLTFKGQTQTIPPQNITVRELDTNKTVLLDAELSKTTAALGEPLTLTYTLVAHADLQQLQLNLPLLDGTAEFDCQPIVPKKLTRRHLKLPAGNQNVFALQESDSTQLKLTFALTLIPRKPGSLTLKPASLICEIIDQEATRQARNQRRRSRRDPFDDDFFSGFGFSQRVVTTTCAAHTRPLSLTVVEPPAENRPASYTGLAEPCTVSVTADQTQVHVGDPIVLNITIAGPKFPQSLRLPKLAALPHFSENFRVFDSDEPGQPQEDGSVTFKRTIRAANDNVTQIPPVDISWFNAASKLYQTASSKPIDITVRGTKTAQAVISDLNAYNLNLDKVDVTALNHTPQDNFPPADCLDNQAGTDTVAAFLQPLLLPLAIPGGCAALLACLAAFRHLRLRNPRARRARQAAAHARAILQQAKEQTVHQAAIEAVFTFLADKCDRNPQSMTLQDAESLLKAVQASPDQHQLLKQLVNDCESCIYAGSRQLPPAQLKERALELVGQLEETFAVPARRGASARTAALFLACLLFPLALPAAAPELAPLQQAEQLYLQGLQAAKENPQQAQELWQQAVDLYQQALAQPQQFDNARLRFNLANVHLAQKQLGLAIANYLRALRLEPDNPKILANLNLARAQRRDQLAPDEQSRVLKTVFTLHYDMTLTTRRAILAVSGCLFFATLALALALGLWCPQALSRCRLVLKTVLALSLLLTLVTATSVAISLQQRQLPQAVIIVPAVHAKAGASNAYQDAFEQPLHDGTECTLLKTDASGSWHHVELPNQLQCWLPADALLQP